MSLEADVLSIHKIRMSIEQIQGAMIIATIGDVIISPVIAVRDSHTVKALNLAKKSDGVVLINIMSNTNPALLFQLAIKKKKS